MRPEVAPSAHLPIQVSGVAVRSSNEVRGQFRLHEFQVEVERAAREGGLVTVDAPTGSGKTLAALLAAWQAGPGDGRFAVFVLPTNQLVEKQTESLSSLIIKAGLAADSGIVRAVTSESLEREARARGFKSHGRALLSLLQEMRGGILLTNPEMLLVLLKGVPRLAHHDALFKEIFSSLGAVVIDEVHLYYGFSLANLTHALYLLRKKVDLFLAMSATPSGLREIKEVFSAAGIRCVDVRAERRDWWVEDDLSEDGSWNPVRMPGELRVIPGSAKVLWSRDDLEAMEKICAGAYEALTERPLPTGAVRLLVLVNSVIFAESLARRLEDRLGVDVSRVHGLVPPEERRAEGEIVVGTRAVDVGVDFNALGVVFEASDAPTFIQRLGRGCRKESGPAWAVVHPGTALALTKKLGSMAHYSSLTEAVGELMSKPSVYGEFLRSEWAALTYASTLLALLGPAPKKVQRMPGVGSEKWKRLQRLAEELGLPCQVEQAIRAGSGVSPAESLARLAAMHEQLVNALIPSLMRGASLTFRAEFLTGPVPVSWRVSVTDLWKLSFRVEERDGEQVVVVKDIRPEGQPVRVKLLSGGLDKLLILKSGDNANFTVETPDPRLRKGVIRLLDGQPCLMTQRKSDWRFQSLPASMLGECENCELILGPDALVGRFSFSETHPTTFLEGG